MRALLRAAFAASLAALALPAPAQVLAPADPALRTWVSAWFAWGDGDITVERDAHQVAGWTVWRATKKFRAPFQAVQDRVDAVVSPDGKTALLGNVFADEERKGAPVATDADLAGLRDFMKQRVLGAIHATVSLDPSLDVAGFRGLSVAVDTGYENPWIMPGYVSAADGRTLVLGRSWRTDRTIPEQRKAMIDLTETPSEGAADAKVTIVEYSDMQCPMCKRRSGELPQLLDRMKGELSVRRYVKTYPLTDIHPWAFRAASAARCFYRKDPKLFFSFKSNVFARQEQLEVSSLDAFVVDFANANGVPDVVSGCYLKPANDARILKDIAEGFTVGVRSTPSYFVDGVLFVWMEDGLFEEMLRKTYLGGKGLAPKPAADKAKAPPAH